MIFEAESKKKTFLINCYFYQYSQNSVVLFIETRPVLGHWKIWTRHWKIHVK